MQPESCKAEQSNARHTKSIFAAWPRKRGGSLGFGRTLFEPQPSATNGGCMRSKDEPSFAAHPLEEHGLAPQQCTVCLAKHHSHSGHSSCWQQHRPSRSSHTSIRQKCYKVHNQSNPIQSNPIRLSTHCSVRRSATPSTHSGTNGCIKTQPALRQCGSGR
jgi:hypothetical protein